MKKTNRILAVAITVALLGAFLIVPAHASIASGLKDLFGELFNNWGQSNPNDGDGLKLSDLFNNPQALEQIREALSQYGGNGEQYTDGQILQALSGLLNGEGFDPNGFYLSDILSNSTLGKLLELLPGTTPVPTTEPTTVPTTVPTTEPTTYVMPVITLPSTQPYTMAPYIPSWSGAAVYTTAPSTAPATQPSYVYVEPSTQVVPQLTTMPMFTPVEEDTPLRGASGNGKMIAGAAILVVALAAVVVVAIMLKKTRV